MDDVMRQVVGPSSPVRRRVLLGVGLGIGLLAAPRIVVADEVADREPISLRFSEFYAPTTSPLALQLSDKILAANGARITINGWVAPPLKPDVDFFVLTRRRLAVCPFCSSAADWPEDILLVTLGSGEAYRGAETVPVTVTGRLEVGEAIDETTGFFSLLRLRAEQISEFRA